MRAEVGCLAPVWKTLRQRIVKEREVRRREEKKREKRRERKKCGFERYKVIHSSRA